MRVGCALIAASLTLVGSPALAYVGPGLGLGVIGVVLGLIFAVFLAIFAVFLGPVKRLFGRKKKTEKKQPDVRE